MTVQITGVGGVPVDGVVAVAVNVTSVNATAADLFDGLPERDITSLVVDAESGPRPRRGEHDHGRSRR